MGCDCCKKRKVIEKSTPKETKEFKEDEDIQTKLLNNNDNGAKIDIISHEMAETKTNPNIEGEDEKAKVIPLFNPVLNLLPTIVMYFEYDCEINEELYNKLKDEISEIIDKKNFSIIEIQKGSAFIKMVLINELAEKGIKASQSNKVSDETCEIIKRLEEKKFACLGNNCSSNTKYNIPDYSKEENRKKLIQFLKDSKDNEDVFQAVSTIKDEDFNAILEENLEKITNSVIVQEINQKKHILNNLEKFNNEIELVLGKKKLESIFEFSVTGLSLIDRDKTEYENSKEECNNMITQFLFHGTSTDSSSKIVTTNFRSANTAFFGPGIYMTDMLDYAGFYAFESNQESKFINHGKIRNVDETFNIVASQVFYDKSKLEKCYKKTNEIIQENGIRFVNVDASGQPLSKEQTKLNGYRKFIGTEYVIPSKNQILPLYSITLKRNEYYCLWKDYHFTHQTSYTAHALEVKNLARQLLGINMYGVGEFDEALDIIKRKKYNKVMLLSNVGDPEKAIEFINEIRRILCFNVVVLFYTASFEHLYWIKDFPNALFTIDEKFFKEYILNFTEKGLNELRNKIEIEYGIKLNNFQADFSYPLFDEAENNDYDSIDID